MMLRNVLWWSQFFPQEKRTPVQTNEYFEIQNKNIHITPGGLGRALEKRQGLQIIVPHLLQSVLAGVIKIYWPYIGFV